MTYRGLGIESSPGITTVPVAEVRAQLDRLNIDARDVVTGLNEFMLHGGSSGGYSYSTSSQMVQLPTTTWVLMQTLAPWKPRSEMGSSGKNWFAQNWPFVVGSAAVVGLGYWFMVHSKTPAAVKANRRRARRRTRRNGSMFQFDVYNEYGQALGSARGVGYVSALAALFDEPVSSFEARGTVERGTNIKEYVFRGSIHYFVSRRLGQYMPPSLDEAKKIARGHGVRRNAVGHVRGGQKKWATAARKAYALMQLTGKRVEWGYVPKENAWLITDEEMPAGVISKHSWSPKTAARKGAMARNAGKQYTLDGYVYEFTTGQWVDPFKASDDDWDTVVVSSVKARKIGERRIDGSKVAVLQAADGQVYAVLPQALRSNRRRARR